MKYLFTLILATLLATPVKAAEVLIIQSHHNQIYDSTTRQIQKTCGMKSRTYVMGDYAEFDLDRIVREEQPRLVITVGDKPLKESLKLRTVPVLYTMALSAEEYRLRNNIAGISMHASPETYLKLLSILGLRRAGVVYNQKKSGAYMERARKSASQYGIELVTKQVHSPTEVAAALTGFTGRTIDSIWMIPDTTAVTAETVDAYFLTAQTSSVPLISFSRAYLGKGALAVLEASRSKMTEQLCNRIRQILGGADPADIPPDDIAEATLYTNKFIAQKLNFSFSEAKQLFRSSQE